MDNAKNHNYAFNPASCVFVSANAGSGKTSLLTNRVLSLLLHGVEPARILCLTFTNAAAAEMSNRILTQLGNWIMMEDEELIKSVRNLTDSTPTSTTLARARGLFAHVLESPEGVRIQTIHGFSQSLLKRFPLEAGITPHFTVMDGRSEQEALAEARLRLFNHRHDPLIEEALNQLARTISEHGFHALLDEIIKNKRRFRDQPLGWEDTLPGHFGLSPHTNEATLLTEYFIYDEPLLTQLRKAASLLLQSEKPTDQKTGQALASWLSGEPRSVTDYLGAFLTEAGEPRKILFTKSALTDETLADALRAEQQRIYHFSEKQRALAAANHSLHVARIAQALLAEYEAIKRQHAWMDYDDLILTARDLLTRAGMAAWVLFKLDGGIDHILVDEAQDTSPEQWHIISALTQEFFAGQGASEKDRSLFIVGDEKQSIYSFQGADVKELGKMQRYFTQAAQAAGKPLHTLSLTKSYRSTSEVLGAVDAIFAQPQARDGLTFGDAPFTHILTRTGQPGLVELWPLIQPSDEHTSPATLLARQLASSIGQWIENGEARPGDIMVLVRTRTSFVDKLVRMLKRNNIPVAGHDRMKLNDSLAVQDLIALGQCILLPEDDLTLASLLKSPLCNISEDALFTLAHDRGEHTLWQRLAQQQPDIYALLAGLRARADFTPPFELYSYALDTLGARARFTGRMGEEAADPIDEFLNQALLYERTHAPSLQGFLHWLAQSDSEIKRDMEQAKNAVRIMTIHGAKGLQSKIVILPDTVELPKQQDSLLWHNGAPMRALSSKQDDALCRRLRTERAQAAGAEYRRLFYVALTRAEDRLYICGATGKDSVNEQSWYHLAKTGLEDVATLLPDGVLRICADDRQQMTDDKKINASSSVIRHPSSDFAFLTQNPPSEPTPSKPLTPSRVVGAPPASASPLSETKTYAAGRYIHLLLQHLPGATNREEMAARLAAPYRAQLPPETITQATQDAIAIIEHRDFAFLFAEDALAEVPVAGVMDGIAISGQIDRLYIGEQDIWIVDFKSNQSPPARVPAPYIRQLALYRLLLQHIYPQKQVHCALLWTATAKMDVIAHALLDEWQSAT